MYYQAPFSLQNGMACDTCKVWQANILTNILKLCLWGLIFAASLKIVLTLYITKKKTSLDCAGVQVLHGPLQFEYDPKILFHGIVMCEDKTSFFTI